MEKTVSMREKVVRLNDQMVIAMENNQKVEFEAKVDKGYYNSFGFQKERGSAVKQAQVLDFSRLLESYSTEVEIVPLNENGKQDTNYEVIKANLREVVALLEKGKLVIKIDGAVVDF